MIVPTLNVRSRRGTTTVEFAFVVSIGLLFLFGILEYSRYLFMLHLANNAAREAARFAAVRNKTDTTIDDVKNVVTQRMVGYQTVVQNYQVEVLNVDPDTGKEIPGTTWQDSAFGDAIMVRVTGEFSPILPDFLLMGANIPIGATAMASSESN